MDKLLLIALAMLAIAMIVLTGAEGGISVLLILGVSFLVIFPIRRFAGSDTFPVTIFLAALLARLALGLLIHYFELRRTFGPDAFYYDIVGQRLAEIWSGAIVSESETTARAMATAGSGWGMNYLVGVLYLLFGQSMLVVQSFCAIIGAATAPMVYFCAERIFANRRVSRAAALSIALFPAFVIWSSQLMKDGLIIFLLVVAMTMVLQIQKKFSPSAVIVLVLSLFGILSLRFYIFYIVAIAIAGSFLIGLNTSVKSILRNVATVVLIGGALVYMGVAGTATREFKIYGSLERVQMSRSDLVESASSGFGGDIDVSTPEGALAAIPVGMANLMLAPFPWQVTKWNQAMILPEMFVWWAMIPLMIVGLWYTVRNRLREAMPVLLFVGMLTVAYSIFQGNVGMAYRQRTQIQVFLFVFISVGWTIWMEKREDRKTLERQRRAPSMLGGRQPVTTNLN